MHSQSYYYYYIFFLLTSLTLADSAGNSCCYSYRTQRKHPQAADICIIEGSARFLSDIAVTEHLGLKPKKPGQPNKKRFFGARIAHYASKGCSTFQVLTDGSISLILAGDIQTNPGPTRNPCSACQKAVTKNHRALSCDSCELWCHIKCGNFSPAQYTQLQLTTNISWNCPACIRRLNLSALPVIIGPNIPPDHDQLTPEETVEPQQNAVDLL